jgi:outer membrane usher protein FimD/PapC/outer membrane protein OmpA-like peptidoglycan-associated protein
MIISAITVNHEEKGEFFIVKRDDGNFLVLSADLEQMGFQEQPPERVIFDGEKYVSLKDIQGLSFSFEEFNLTLKIMADPLLLGKSSIDLAFHRQENVYYPQETSVFLNYGINYSSGGASSHDFQNFNVSNEFGLHVGNGLFTSDAIYTETPDEENLVRLNTRAIWDQQEQLRRFILGDFAAESGDLGSRLQMGGFSFSKVYQMDPYFIRYPLFDFSGLLSLPSDVDLYVDGVKIRTEHFAPGEFELRNFQGIRGAQTVEVVIRDALGREQRIAIPIYATDQVLSKGLHEYSYNLGFLRRDFGSDSDHYDNHPAFSAFHRYGLTDEINVGVHTEAGEDLVNFGFESAFVSGSFGLMRVDVSASSNSGVSGTAGQLTYEYQTPGFNVRLGLQAYSPKFRNLGDLKNLTDRKLNLFASMGYLTAKLGSFGIRYLEAQHYHEENRREVAMTWSRNLKGHLYLSTTASLVDEERQYLEASLSLNWHFANDRTVTTSYRHEQTTDTQNIEIRQNIPAGQGTGWSLRGERSEIETATTKRLDSYIQHNAQHAIMRADIGVIENGRETSTDSRLALSGALVYVGNTLGLTRPVRDSFSLVRVGNVENVGVYANGQIAGRTNNKGKLFVPDLSSYYDNRISFEDKDVPLDYLMPQVKLAVSPPLRSGSCINFPLKRYQAFTGTFMIEIAGENIPLQNAELVLQSSSGPVKFWTGGDGEFYLDSQMNELDILSVQGCDAEQADSTAFLPAGTYPLTVKLENETFQSELTIPASDEAFAELGSLTLPVLAGSPPEQAPATDQRPATEAEPASVESKEPIHETNQAGELPEALPPFAAEALPPFTAETKQKSVQPDQQAVDDALPLFTIHFPLDSSIPLPDEQPILDQALNYLIEHPERPIDIEGHADQQGSAAYNQKLGYWRAQALRDYLVNAGINPRRFSRIVSYGESKPLCRDTSEDCLSQNRRAIVLVAITPEN